MNSVFGRNHREDTWKNKTVLENETYSSKNNLHEKDVSLEAMERLLLTNSAGVCSSKYNCEVQLDYR